MIATRTEAEDALFRAGLVDDDATVVVRRGHFVYQSGNHGDAWLDLERLFTDARRLQRAAGTLAQKLRSHGIDFVCGPAAGGVLVGQPVAATLDRPFVAAERRDAAGGVAYEVSPRLRALLAGARAAVVADVINGGSAALGTARALRSLGATVAVLGALVARASAVLPVDAFDGVPVERLASVDWSLWPPASCPLCAAGVPLTVHAAPGAGR